MIKVVSNYLVKSRKAHLCDGCNRTFNKGTELERLNLKDTDTGKFEISYLCPTCQIVIRENFPEDGQYEQGEFHDLAVNYEHSIFNTEEN